MKIKCLDDNYTYGITQGIIYKVQQEDDENYFIINDEDKKCQYNKSRFEIENDLEELNSKLIKAYKEVQIIEDCVRTIKLKDCTEGKHKVSKSYYAGDWGDSEPDETHLSCLICYKRAKEYYMRSNYSYDNEEIYKELKKSYDED